MTAADWKRAGAAGFGGVGLYTFDIRANGAAFAHDWDARVTALGGDRVVISKVLVCNGTQGTYRWRVAARRLTLTKLRDPCKLSVGLFAGVWKRR